MSVLHDLVVSEELILGTLAPGNVIQSVVVGGLAVPVGSRLMGAFVRQTLGVPEAKELVLQFALPAGRSFPGNVLRPELRRNDQPTTGGF